MITSRKVICIGVAASSLKPAFGVVSGMSVTIPKIQIQLGYHMENKLATDLPKGFIGSLFDLSFTYFITSKIIKLLYILSIAIAALIAISAIISGFAASTTIGVFTLLIVAPLLFLLGVIYARVVLEIIIVTFRISEHAAQIAANVEKAVSAGSEPVKGLRGGDQHEGEGFGDSNQP